MTPAEEAARRSVYQTASRDLLQPLPEIGESVMAQLIGLHQQPTPAGCERIAMELDGVRRHVLKIREALQREAAAKGAA